MIGVPSSVLVALLAALSIGASGVPGCLWRHSAAAGQPMATALHLIGSALGFASLALFAREGDIANLSFGRLPVGELAFGIDGLSALFLVPILVVSTLGSLYGRSYWSEREHPDSSRKLRFWWGLITAAMIGVVLARDAVLFLLAWEVMALSAFFLIGTEEESPAVRRASWVYLVATHAGTLCLLGFFALLVATTGSFALWPSLPSERPTWLATALFGLGIAGFGLKAGLMPLHVWLPGAHANAPSHVSALLSGVMLKTGVYGVVRVCGLLPDPPLWWGGALVAAGCLSGVLGIAFAVAQQDLKRLLAYSSIENIGVITIGIGLAGIGRALGDADLVALGLGGALLHVLNHSLFKPLLFLAAGNVLHATGTRQLSALGGLAKTMPHTFLLFVVGAVAICGLPPLNGFVSEWLLYVGLLHTAASGDGSGWPWASLAVPALAMIGALAVAAFVKASGIAFGGVPRTSAAAHAHDPARGMLGPMGGLAAACLAIGLLPSASLPFLRRAIVDWDPVLGAAGKPLAELVPFAWISGAGVVLIASVALLAAGLRRSLSAPATVPTWDCAYGRPAPRMQYGAASFSETLERLFGWALRPRVGSPISTDPFPRRSEFRHDTRDAVLDDVVEPAFRAVEQQFSRARVFQRGPVHMYLLYVFLTIVLLLVVAR